jgi:hypothetical protein
MVKIKKDMKFYLNLCYAPLIMPTELYSSCTSKMEVFHWFLHYLVQLWDKTWHVCSFTFALWEYVFILAFLHLKCISYTVEERYSRTPFSQVSCTIYSCRKIIIYLNLTAKLLIFTLDIRIYYRTGFWYFIRL